MTIFWPAFPKLLTIPKESGEEMTQVQTALFDAHITDWLGNKIGVGDKIMYATRWQDGTKTMVLATVEKLSVTKRWGIYFPQMLVQPLGESRDRKRPRSMHRVVLTVFEGVTKVPEAVEQTVEQDA